MFQALEEMARGYLYSGNCTLPNLSQKLIDRIFSLPGKKAKPLQAQLHSHNKTVQLCSLAKVPPAVLQSSTMRSTATVGQDSMCLSYQSSMLLLTRSSTVLSSVTTKHTWLDRAQVIGPLSSQTWELKNLSGSDNALSQQAPAKDRASSFQVHNM